MKPTIRDVAREAKVSIATVSKVLNNLGGYSKDTEERVLKTIKEIGYEANALARGLATKSSKVLGVLIPNITNNVYAEVINGIDEVAHKNGYSIIICNTADEEKRTAEYVKVLSSNQVAGIIYGSSAFFDECFEIIDKLKMPCVLALTVSYKYQMPYVKVDDTQAAYAATRYLIENGHKKIAMISGPEKDMISGAPRIEGYRRAMKDYGIEISDKLFEQGDFWYEDGKATMEKLLDGGEEFTAIFAASDNMALGALNTAHQRGIKVPEEISIIGYDNTNVAKMSFPPLTTVSQPFNEIGQRAAEKLLAIIENNEKVESTIVPYEIVERGTVKNLKLTK